MGISAVAALAGCCGVPRTVLPPMWPAVTDAPHGPDALQSSVDEELAAVALWWPWWLLVGWTSTRAWHILVMWFGLLPALRRG